MMFLSPISFLLAVGFGLAHATEEVVKIPSNTSLPIVDLGYVKQQASWYNPTENFYVFKNVRYAKPPLGELRFRKPVPPVPEEGIQNGSVYWSPICPQSPSDLSGVSNDSTMTEDCLFLDVYVPKGIERHGSVPVLLWIYGGGYTVGSKDGFYDPTGLFERTSSPMIFVSANYRLGAFGWLSPPDEDITPNVGLYDVRAAMSWVEKYISAFGGDCDRVTVMGESAGAGNIMHTITAYGGAKSPPPFQQAIMQSPGLVPVKNNPQGRTNLYKAFLTRANCTSLKCLRAAPTSALIDANKYLVTYGAGPNAVGFGPVVDGDYLPDLASRLLHNGKFHRTLKGLISANNAREGGFYIGPPEDLEAGAFESFLSTFLPTISSSANATLYKLYPPAPAEDTIGEWTRVTDFVGDVQFTCNAQFLASAFTKGVYRYIFSVPPAYHGDDVAYTFYNDGEQDVNISIAHNLQDIIINFVTTGIPTSRKEPGFPEYWPGRRSLFFNSTNEVDIDPWKSKRCDWWQTGLFAENPRTI